MEHAQFTDFDLRKTGIERKHQSLTSGSKMCNGEQFKINKTIRNKLEIYNRGIERDAEYKKHKGSKDFKLKYAHEFHIGNFNGLIRTAKNAIDAGYDIPNELVSLLLEHMISRINGSDEWQVVTDLQKTDLDDFISVEHDFYTRSICWIIEGHKDARQEQQRPETRFNEKIASGLYNHSKYDFPAKLYGYKLAFKKTKLTLKDFGDYFLGCDESLDESTVRKKINNLYNLRPIIDEYLEELKIE